MISPQSQPRVLLTGGHGFLGDKVYSALSEHGYNLVYRFHSKEYDLTTEDGVVYALRRYHPDIVIHLAAVVGGIGINREKPGTFYYKNLVMGAMLLEHSRTHGVKKFVAIGSICAYPKHTPVPFKEEDLWNGYPEETNAPYGIAKKSMLVQSRAYRQEFGFNSIYLLPVNLYGPRDNFDPNSSHVIPALIKKCVDAKETGQKSITCWGSGEATREFLYVDDAAEAIALATETYDEAEPINVGSGIEIKISDLVRKIANLVGFTGDIIWDKSFPDGQPRRCLSVNKAKEKFGFVSKTSFDDGLAKTIKWYTERSNGQDQHLNR